jgi:hypothetical protein
MVGLVHYLVGHITQAAAVAVQHQAQTQRLAQVAQAAAVLVVGNQVRQVLAQQIPVAVAVAVRTVQQVSATVRAVVVL